MLMEDVFLKAELPPHRAAGGICYIYYAARMEGLKLPSWRRSRRAGLLEV